jgi:hypothetical protein
LSSFLTPVDKKFVELYKLTSILVFSLAAEYPKNVHKVAYKRPKIAPIAYQTDKVCPDCLKPLMEAVGLARGDFLAGLVSLTIAQNPSQAQLRTSKSSWWPADQVEIERNLALIRAALDPETCAAVWLEGQAMSLAEAVVEVLR